jgi:hypothetical protein
MRIVIIASVRLYREGLAEVPTRQGIKVVATAADGHAGLTSGRRPARRPGDPRSTTPHRPPGVAMTVAVPIVQGSDFYVPTFELRRRDQQRALPASLLHDITRVTYRDGLYRLDTYEWWWSTIGTRQAVVQALLRCADPGQAEVASSLGSDRQD